MESDPVQSVGFHEESLRDELCGDTEGADSCKLPDKEGVFLRQIVLRG